MAHNIHCTYMHSHIRPPLECIRWELAQFFTTMPCQLRLHVNKPFNPRQTHSPGSHLRTFAIMVLLE